MATWTIEKIEEALGSAVLVQRFRATIRTEPLETVPALLAKWVVVAEETLAAVARGRELAEYEARGEPLPGVWIDRTEKIRAAAEEIERRRQGA